MRGRNPYQQALLTYWRRPAFGVLITLMCFVCAIWTLMLNVEVHRWDVRVDPWGVLGSIIFLLEMIGAFSPVVLLITFVALVMSHLRAQMENEALELVPGFRRPHLVIGLAVFLAVPLAMVGWGSIAGQIDKLTTGLGLLAILLSLMTLTAAWASFHRPWLSLPILPLLVLAFFWERFDWFIGTLISPVRSYELTPNRILYQLQIIGIDLLILLLVAIRTGRRRRSAPVKWRIRIERIGLPKPETPAVVPRPATTPMARAWHRRRGVLDPWAPWYVGAILAALLVLATFVAGHREPDLLRSVLFPTVVPGVAISLIWRERWGNIGYESLYPARRSDFVGELVVATAIQLAELWFATALAAIVPITIWDPVLLSKAIFWATLLASVAMQFMVFGVMFVAALFRAALLYVNLLTILAALVPITFAWADKPLLSPRGLLMVGMIQMLCGLALTAFGSSAWRRADLA